MEITIRVPPGAERVGVLGSAERNLKLIREALGVGITARNGSVLVTGPRSVVATVRRVFDQLAAAAERNQPLDRQQVLNLLAETVAEGLRPRRGWSSEDAGGETAIPGRPDWDGSLNVYAAGRLVRPRTANQEAYLDAIRDHDLVFAVGPAGTGKTYLAVAAAVHMLKSDRVRRAVLVRPAVEAGEKLGFLPGDLRDKVNPYLRPLFDALNDMMDFATVRRFIESDVVEVAPLAFMRGRTLNNAVIILDEAQNTTKGQMKMFLTRMGQGSKMVVTGDVTQIDLPDPTESGLIDGVRRLSRTRGVGMISFDRSDVVRHELVQRVIDAYGGDSEEPPKGRRTGSRQTARNGVQASDNLQTTPTAKPMEEK